MYGVGLLLLARSRFVPLGVLCRCVAGGCPCVEQIVVGGAGLSAVVVCCVVALCSVSLELMADCWLMNAGASCSSSLASHGISSLRLSPLASLPVCTSASLVVPARDPVAHGCTSSGGHP